MHSLSLMKVFLMMNLRFFSGSDGENLNFEKWAAFKKKGLHFVHININSLPPKIDELRYLTKLPNASIVGIGETKLDDSISSSEIEIEGYDLLRLDRSCRGGGEIFSIHL